MPIYRLLQNAALGPQDIVRVVQAYDDVLQRLGLRQTDDKLTQMIARLVFEAAQTGEQDSRKISRAALQQLTTMSYLDFESDALYFEILAREQTDAAARNELGNVAFAYRAFAKTHGGWFSGRREEHWRKRAEECRTLADQFRSETCRDRLLRLAETYDKCWQTANAPENL